MLALACPQNQKPYWRLLGLTWLFLLPILLWYLQEDELNITCQGLAANSGKQENLFPAPPHWDRIDQVVTYKFQINGKTQPNLQCALSLTPFTDFNLSTLLPSKELKINLMTFFKYEIGKKKKWLKEVICLECCFPLLKEGYSLLLSTLNTRCLCTVKLRHSERERFSNVLSFYWKMGPFKDVSNMTLKESSQVAQSF